MSAQDKFQELITNENGLFPAICDMMLHSQVENGRRFLCAMNNLVDYCIQSNDDNTGTINHQIVYVPTCPEWARELLVRFFIHKVAFTSSSRFLTIAKQKTKGDIVLPTGLSSSSKQFKQIIGEREFFRKFKKLFEGKIPDNDNASKTLFVVQEKDIITRKQDKNPWLGQLFSNDLIGYDGHVLLTTSLNAEDIENLLKKNRERVPKVENLFIFHSQNRGKITYSYHRDQLERLNQYGMGIKNCFVFYISERPFRLYSAIDNIKYSLASNLLQQEVKSYDAFDGFITFTPEELDSIFQRKNLRSKYIIDSPEREIFTADIDSYFDELPHNYKIKNNLSLAFSYETENTFINECEYDSLGNLARVVGPFLNYYRQYWSEEIAPRIRSFIEGSHLVAFVLPPGIDKTYRNAIRNRFSSENRKVYIADFERLKDGLDADCVVLFTFRYTDFKYKSYPNSFDPLPLKAGQKGLTIINRLTHNRYYEWNQHFYDKDFNGLLYSSFRKQFIGWSKRVLQRPVMVDILNNIDEAEADAREYMAEKCIVVFDQGRTKRLAADRALFHDGNHYCISSLKELPFEEGMQIQMLDELVDQIKDSLIKKTDRNLKSEGYIRRDPVYELTEEQINSPIELWKYLLKRKVEVMGVEAAYEAVFPRDKEISLRGFEKWIDFDYPMILPRSRKSQNNLLRFLGFELGSPYHRIILTKKLLSNNRTRLLNSQIESLLQSILTINKIQDKDFDELFEEHSEILTLLEIKSASDANTLVELLDISLKTVKSITYDSDKA